MSSQYEAFDVASRMDGLTAQVDCLNQVCATAGKGRNCGRGGGNIGGQKRKFTPLC